MSNPLDDLRKLNREQKEQATRIAGGGTEPPTAGTPDGVDAEGEVPATNPQAGTGLRSDPPRGTGSVARGNGDVSLPQASAPTLQEARVPRARRRADIARDAEVLGATPLTIITLKVPQGLDRWMEDRVHEHRFDEVKLTKQAMLRRAMQLLYVEFETGNDEAREV